MQPRRVKRRFSAAFSPSFPARASETALPPQFRLPFRARFSDVFFRHVVFCPFCRHSSAFAAFRHGLSGATLPEGWFLHGLFPSSGILASHSFPAENISQNPRQKKDKSAPSRGGCSGELLYPLFISANAGKALAVPSRNTAVSRAIRRGRGCLPVRTMPLWISGRGRKQTSGKPRADLPQRRAGRS